MKNRDLIKKLLDFNMDAEVLVSIGDTFDDVIDIDMSWGGPNSKDGETKEDVEFIYFNTSKHHERN